MKKWLIVLFFFRSLALAEERIEIGRFSAGELSGWESKRFAGKSDYRLMMREGVTVLRAQSGGEASGLIKKKRIDLRKTPFLHWRWRIDKRLAVENERKKSGDDYAARIYVVVSGGWAFWKTRAVNYVWSAHQDKGAIWPNAFAGDNAMMVALRDRDDKLCVWYQERRNVRADLQRLFGERIRFIDAVAIMTDTDNAGGEAESYYGDIFFSDE